MSTIKGHARKGSLLKNVQPSVSVNERPNHDDRESPTTNDKTQILKTKEAASFLNLSVRTFNQYVIDHEIPFIEWSPRVRRFMISDLEKIALSRKTKKQIY
ncbi:helix-turn-helix domain-containing protein [Leptospira yasudae]|uniref:DNA-binding protein n=1 Tax=Leptospira yasudae TaxID=2202201 RepID=A0ABX9M8Q7_9LEPT|nr:helix-turn-helix domain-containing protein [Leptospira yasudae]RHX82222.1 DNA-binding protein [Leptospira yasudae]